MDKRYLLFIIGLMSALNHELIASPSTVATGFYTSQNLTIKPTQFYLMQQVVRIHFDENVKTIGEALKQLLNGTGMQVNAAKLNPAFKSTLNLPLPLTCQNLGPLTLRQAIQVLVGPAFIIKVNTLHRTIQFPINPAYAHDV